MVNRVYSTSYCGYKKSGNQSCLLITFANSLDTDQVQQNVGPDLDPNYMAH